MIGLTKYSPFIFVAVVFFMCCGERQQLPDAEGIVQLHLKRGAVISCGSAIEQFGTTHFTITGTESSNRDFNVALELLHSFEYDDAEKVFARIIDAEPGCAMAYWGVAMCSFHPLWEPPSPADLEKGARAVSIANRIRSRSALEAGFIVAAADYYQDWQKTDARARSVRFEAAMQKLHERFSLEQEVSIFYALSLTAAADPKDQNYLKQRKAGAILEALYRQSPNHPGIVHYIIHTYDYPGLAKLGLAAAERYASVEPSSAHAQHMPSHIFTRLGLWDKVIASNIQSVASAQCYASSAHPGSHWDEEMHGLDYLVYAYLQVRNNDSALSELRYISSIDKVYPENFKVAYAFAAIPSRIALENKNWEMAAAIALRPNFPWARFPWQEAIVHFARLLGSVHTEKVPAAQKELGDLHRLRDTLLAQHDPYKAAQVAIQIIAGEAWISYALGRKEAALKSMKAAAEAEDSTTKHPVTPGEVLPARELYGDMLLESKRYADALEAYNAVLTRAPNRFNSVQGVQLAKHKLEGSHR